MKNKLTLALFGVVITLMVTSDVMAQRGRGGGGRGGGGGARSGGGMSRSMGSSPSMSRPSPSMSRPTQSMNRPTPSAGRPAPSAGRTAQGGVQNRAAAGGNRSAGQRPGTATAGQLGVRSPQSFQRPSQQGVQDFLNLPPQREGGGGATAGGDRPSASGRSSSGGDGPTTITTPGGAEITYGGKSGSGVTEGGATAGGAVGGIKIETAGGETIGRVGAVGGVTDGTNSAIRGGSITGASDGQGNTAANVRGGYADSSGYRQGGSVSAVQNRAGYTQAWGTAGYGYGNGTGQIGSAAAVRGPGGNVISAGHGASYVNGQFVGGQSWSAVNGSYTRWNAFGPGYPGQYPGAWWPGKWAIATTAWATASYATASSYCGCSDEGCYYDYGENVTYEDGSVYMDGQPVGTAEEYYEQAEQIADSGDQAANEEWMPMGVFALVQDDKPTTDRVLQLAVNKEGVFRGNYQDMVADTVTPVTGSLDKKTQRVALKFEGNDEVVVETGLYNLTNDEVPILVHFGPDRQETRKLVRLQRPEDLPPPE